MGQCVCKEERRRRRRRRRSGADDASTSAAAAPRVNEQQQRLADIGLDVRQLVLDTLAVIRTLVNNEQEPPTSMLKLNLIADKEQGWLLIVQTMIEMVPDDNPLGPAVVTLFLDESPLPTRDTVLKLLLHLDLAESAARPPVWHRNVCIVIGCLAEKLAGANSVATFRPETLDYLLRNLRSDADTRVILFSLVALEKYAQTSENRAVIAEAMSGMETHPLECLEGWLASRDFVKRQIGFCAQWCLDNLFSKTGRSYSYQTVSTKGINAMLNHYDVSEYLKIAPNGLEARCDVSSFESVRCTFQVSAGAWYYEALIVTPGVMQIGWATKESKFFNHEGFGIGDDEYSVAYDGCRQLIWHNAASAPNTHAAWRPGDVLGCLLDSERAFAQFYLNGRPMSAAHGRLFAHAHGGFFAAASFMSFQQCHFNFGAEPFRHAPADVAFRSFNDVARLTDEQRVILPRRKKLELLRQASVPEDSCQLCYACTADTTLLPCNHTGFCAGCGLLLEVCPLCRAVIAERVTDCTVAEAS